MTFFDSHAHLSSFSQDVIDGMLERAERAGVIGCIDVATDSVSLSKSLELAQKSTQVKIFSAAATTPHDVHRADPEFFALVEEAAAARKLCAIGETGLDYYYEHSPRSAQKSEFLRSCALARTYNLPLIIHCRDAFADLFSLFDEERKKGPLVGVMHCFTGTLAEAEEALRRGLYISLSGIVTFSRAANCIEVARRVPLERLLIETDTPYLAPEPYRGRKNEPSFVVEVAKKIADVRGVEVEKIAGATYQTAKGLFRL
jgi:TatD DNase family protein